MNRFSNKLAASLMALFPLIGAAPTLASQVTIERILVLPDHSASSADSPATLGPSGEGSGTSRGSVDGQPTGEAPIIDADGLPQPSGEFSASPSSVNPTEVGNDIGSLPTAVQRMHDTLLRAALSGEINNLRLAIEMNEMPPILGFDGNEGDPINQILQMSGDLQGSEILAILSEILEAGFAHVDQGTPQEMYVWPYFAHYPLDALNARQRIDLFRIVTASEYEEMRSIGQYIFFRIGIGPDGTWHYFVAGD